MGKVRFYNFAEQLIILGTKLIVCDKNCPVISRRRCTYFNIAHSISADPLDIADDDFRNYLGVQKLISSEHCLNLVKQCSGWEHAVYNKKTGKIDKNLY